jgi:hypothetical protein
MVPSISNAPRGYESILVSVSRACAKGVVGALVASAPATVRVAEESRCGDLNVCLALSALAFVPMLLAIVVVRRARATLTEVLGRGLSTFWTALLVWAAIDSLALTGLGAVLRRTTHHHALAGVTFALGATALVILFVPMARRIVQTAGAYSGVVALLAALVLLLVVVALVGTHTSAVAVDLLVFLVVAVAVSVVSAPTGRAGMLGIPLAVALIAGGTWELVSCPSILDVASQHAPIHTWMLETPPPSN